MDVIITYVNGRDPLWKEDYRINAGKEINDKRFRDWGTLRFLFRSLETHVKDLGQIFFVVSRESQVPEWINRDKVKIVLHKDIIPEQLLPVFNASAIEVFLHLIPGLSEKFIYFNDDTFALKDISEEDLFPGGKPVCGMSRHLFHKGNIFRSLCWRSCNFARESLGLKPMIGYRRPQHTINPKLKSVCEELFELRKEDIIKSVNKLRSPNDLNQYIYMCYMYFKGVLVNKRISQKFLSLGFSSLEKVHKYMNEPERQLICLNDANMSEEKFDILQKEILDSFQKHFPQKSSYEL